MSLTYWRLLMMKILERTVMFVLIMCFCSIAHALEQGDVTIDNVQKNNVIVRHSFGVGGPIRESKEYYAGDVVNMFVELPETFTMDGKFSIEFRSFLAFDSGPFLRNDAVAMPYAGLLTKNSSFTCSISCLIPPNIKAGEYELYVEIFDRLNNTKLIKKDIIKILDNSEFGIRRLALCRTIAGTQLMVPGSGYFVAGECAKITFFINGLTTDSDNKVKTMVEIELIDENNQRIDMIDRSSESTATPSFRQIFDNNAVFRVWESFLDFPLMQPGNYHLVIVVHDLNSEKKVGYILPIFVNPSAPAKSISYPSVLETRSEGDSGIDN
jgi:hypothetical protein